MEIARFVVFNLQPYQTNQGISHGRLSLHAGTIIFSTLPMLFTSFYHFFTIPEYNDDDMFIYSCASAPFGASCYCFSANQAAHLGMILLHGAKETRTWTWEIALLVSRNPALTPTRLGLVSSGRPTEHQKHMHSMVISWVVISRMPIAPKLPRPSWMPTVGKKSPLNGVKPYYQKKQQTSLTDMCPKKGIQIQSYQNIILSPKVPCLHLVQVYTPKLYHISYIYICLPWPFA